MNISLTTVISILMELLKFVNSTNVSSIWKICTEIITVQVTEMLSVHVQKYQSLVMVLKDVLISSIKLKKCGPLGTLTEILNSIWVITSLNSKKS
jgi:hypothetical protein